MRIIVTGGAGFIGSHQVDVLSSIGHEVAVIDDLSSGSTDNIPAQIKLYTIDVRDKLAIEHAFADFKPEAVSHQAAQMSVSRSVREPDFDAQVNILGLVNVLSAAAITGARRFVFASSGGVLYGDVTTPAPEETPANPMSPYGITKWAGEKYLKFFVQEHGLECVALRYSNVYGPRQNPHGEAGVVAIFCTRMLQGESSTINGDGKYIRDYVHVSDVVHANVLALEAAGLGFRYFNVGTSRPTDVNQLSGLLSDNCQQLLNQRGIARNVPASTYGPARAGDLRSNLIAYDKIQSELGWVPQVSIEDGLRDTAHWFANKLL